MPLLAKHVFKTGAPKCSRQPGTISPEAVSGDSVSGCPRHRVTIHSTVVLIRHVTAVYNERNAKRQVSLML